MKKTLRIFSLNTEYGKYGKTFLPYIASIAHEVDVFCFQEVPNMARDTTCFEEWYAPNFYSTIEQVLTEFTWYYCEFVKDSFGIATFVRKELKQKYRWESYIFGNSDKTFLDKGKTNNSTKCMVIQVQGIDIMNLHGAWQPKSKKQDTPERLLQSKIIKKLTQWREAKTVLIGDFNLMPDTKSVKMLEKKYKNLITKFGIPCTRTAVYDDVSLPFADYVFIGKNLELIDFSVSLEPVFSDHGFMRLEISKK